MKFQLRDYQQNASNAAISHYRLKGGKNYLMVLPTGAGKSLIIADIAARLNEPLLVFQPNKEILEQNFAKLQTYGIIDAGCYSASVKRKDICRITFATIKSVHNHMKEFNHFKYVLIDECHNVNAAAGMYADFFAAAERRVIGLTATPYRLCSTMNGSMLKFLTRTRPRVFSDVIYYCQVSELLARGFLTKLKYYDLTRIELVNVRRNSTGADYDDRSLSREFERVDLYGYLISMVRRLLAPKSGIPRRGILVFTRFVKEAEMLTHEIPDSAVVSGETPMKERERILSEFKAGKIKVVANCGVLTTGFDYPELDTIVLCRPTMSLSLYYQMIGRVIRPYPGKEGWVVDLCGNIKTFGKVEDLRIEQPEKGKWMVKTNGKQLTNVIL
ncbi:DEAD/DEAH box helicase [uncultured Bacteroides sp.]|uniref:DEAD/DEAH box helicase n=1 Tax=uncultured Bacteroides sp. TaxID=162156 RepID=UPI00259401FA|nr:DEAD/DEAH box helicase [uncultured Bacteroides sp.]